MKVLVLGASSDIGIAVCKTYLSKGWDILAHYRNLREELRIIACESPTRIELLKIDFNDLKAIEENLKLHRERILGCDALVNCAASYTPEKFANITAESISTTFSINLIPGLLFMRDMVPSMISRKWGRVLHLSSIGVKFGGGSESFSYALSKHAIEFLPADYREWAAANILVNVLRVGVTDTRIHLNNLSKNIAERVRKIPIQRMATSQEIALAIWFYCSEDNTYITGQIVSISGGE
jgi:NAD(P)-dependent dehydrogenase (short-subunit alcohol dehydrogenase family)